MESSINKKAPQTSYKIKVYKNISELPDSYRSFILARWLRSNRYGNDMFKLTQSDPYYESYSLFIMNILKRKKINIRIAVLDDDEDVALGWCVDEGDILHYVYIKPEVRRAGIARSMVPKNIKTITHITHTGLSIWQEKLPKINFNPFIGESL